MAKVRIILKYVECVFVSDTLIDYTSLFSIILHFKMFEQTRLLCVKWKENYNKVESG